MMHGRKNIKFLHRFSKNTQISNFMNICPVEAEFFRADRHVDANNHFSQTCKRRYKQLQRDARELQLLLLKATDSWLHQFTDGSARLLHAAWRLISAQQAIDTATRVWNSAARREHTIKITWCHSAAPSPTPLQTISATIPTTEPPWISSTCFPVHDTLFITPFAAA